GEQQGRGVRPGPGRERERAGQAESVGGGQDESGLVAVISHGWSFVLNYENSIRCEKVGS
ncbi:MAG: hypothetical protein AVDCRST_MAG66-1463, partial [uncultured Pseudonocardia sp.]